MPYGGIFPIVTGPLICGALRKLPKVDVGMSASPKPNEMKDFEAIEGNSDTDVRCFVLETGNSGSKDVLRHSTGVDQWKWSGSSVKRKVG